MPEPVAHLHTLGWTLSEWRAHQRKHIPQANETLQQLLNFLQRQKHPSWLYLATSKAIAQQIQSMQNNVHKYPYFGVPLAVKDNIDVADQPTTCSCPSFTYTPTTHAKCVQALVDSGFIVIGKTNMDQFATGLVGTRCTDPVPNAFDPRRICGGSSSGSAFVVAVGWVPLSLGTDTAGSGRVPAGFNNVVGLKPSYQWISTDGVVPACLSLDCVSMFALALKDVADIFAHLSPSTKPAPRPAQWRIAVPSTFHPKADEEYLRAFQQCLQQWTKLPDVTITPVDFNQLHYLANYLYDGPYLVERWEVVKNHINEKGNKDIHPAILETFKDVTKYTSLDVFQALHSISQLKKKIHDQFKTFQAILVPTTLFPPFFITDVQKSNLELNKQLGVYTNFVNLAGWCGISIPAGFLNYQAQSTALPFGITLLGFHGREPSLIQLASTWLCSLGTEVSLALGDENLYHIWIDSGPLIYAFP